MRAVYISQNAERERGYPGSLAEVTGLIAEKGINILIAVVDFDKKSQRYKMILRSEDFKYELVLEELKIGDMKLSQ